MSHPLPAAPLRAPVQQRRSVRRSRGPWSAGPLAILLLVVLAAPAAAQGVQLDSAGPGTAAGLWASRLLNHLSLAAAVGFLLVPAWLLAGREGWTTGLGPGPARRAARLGAISAVVWAASAAGVLVFGLSNAAARPLPQALDPDLLGRFTATRFGTAVAAQVAVALGAALLASLARDRRGAAAALAVVLLGALAPAWWGHAGTAHPRVLAVLSDWLHIAAAAVWVGGLLALVVVVVSRSAGGDPHGPTLRFSGLAGVAVVAVAATGVVNALLHVDAPGQLLTTTWGRSVLLKAALLVALAGIGWVHRRRVLPRLRPAGGAAGARRLFGRLAAAELVLMLAAIAVATTMASGLPAAAEAAARIQTFTADLGEVGLVEVTLDPARAGRNELHLYLFDDGRRLLPVTSAAVVLSSGDERVEPRLVPSGPGHYTAPAVDLPAGGGWTVEVDVEVDGRVERARGALSVR
jgi:copper transport protein